MPCYWTKACMQLASDAIHHAFCSPCQNPLVGCRCNCITQLLSHDCPVIGHIHSFLCMLEHLLYMQTNSSVALQAACLILLTILCIPTHCRCAMPKMQLTFWRLCRTSELTWMVTPGTLSGNSCKLCLKRITNRASSNSLWRQSCSS